VAARLGDTGDTELDPMQRTRQTLGVAAITARVQAIRTQRTTAPATPSRTLSPGAPADRPFYVDPVKADRAIE